MRSERAGREEDYHGLDATRTFVEVHLDGDVDLRQEQADVGSGAATNGSSTNNAIDAAALLGADTWPRSSAHERGEGRNSSSGATGALVALAAGNTGDARSEGGGERSRAADGKEQPSEGGLGIGSQHPMPRINSDPVLVRVGVWLRKLYGIDFSAGDWTGDVVLTCAWSDAFAGRSALPEGSGTAEMTFQAAQGLFWVPDISILYKTSQELLSSVVNVTANGRVTVTQRMLVSVAQNFKEARYPFDDHSLVLQIGSRSLSAGALVLKPVQNETAASLSGVSDGITDTDSEWQYEDGSFSSKAALVRDGLSSRSTIEARVTVGRNSNTGFLSSLLMPEVTTVMMSLCALMLPPTPDLSTMRILLSLSAFAAAFCCLVFNVVPELGYDVMTWFQIFKEACTLLTFEAVVFNLMIEVTASKFEIDALTLQTAFTARVFHLSTIALSMGFLASATKTNDLERDSIIVRLTILLGILVFILWIWWQGRSLRRAVEELEESSEESDSNKGPVMPNVQVTSAVNTAAALSRGSNMVPKAPEAPKDTRGWRRGPLLGAGSGSESERARQAGLMTFGDKRIE